MTLIASYINKYGITVLSDSNLSDKEGNAGFGQKVFPISHLNAALSYSGSYSINSVSVDKWMNDFISGAFFTTKTIEEFVKTLTETLNREMREFESEKITIIHIVGYQEIESLAYAQHFHISNTSLQKDGDYSPPKKTFEYAIDFDTKTSKEHRTWLIALDKDSTINVWYINGYKQARTSANYIRTVLEKTLRDIWDWPDSKFRKPKNIYESATIWKINMEIVAQLFKLSDHEALFVGGEIQSHLIPVPQNIDKSNWV